MELIPGNSLITADPEAGRALAVKMCRLIIKLTKPDETVRNLSLIQVSEPPSPS